MWAGEYGGGEGIVKLVHMRGRRPRRYWRICFPDNIKYTLLILHDLRLAVILMYLRAVQVGGRVRLGVWMRHPHPNMKTPGGTLLQLGGQSEALIMMLRLESIGLPGIP
jgi:hypothetical protein